MLMHKTITAVIAVAFIAGAANAAVVFSDDFESPDVTAAQSDGNTSGAIDTSKWVKAAEGFGSGRQGTVDEAHGDFTDPVGEQAYAFRYTNSGITTVVGAIIGTDDYGDLAAGTVISVAFDVVIDGHNDTTPYAAALVTFDDATARTDMNGGNFSLADGPNAVLATVSGNAVALGDPGYLDYQSVSFSFTIGDSIVSGSPSAADDIALRIYGATSSAIIDNVIVDVSSNEEPPPAVPVPAPAAMGLVGLGLIAGRKTLKRRSKLFG